MATGKDTVAPAEAAGADDVAGSVNRQINAAFAVADDLAEIEARRLLGRCDGPSTWRLNALAEIRRGIGLWFDPRGIERPSGRQADAGPDHAGGKVGVATCWYCGGGPITDDDPCYAPACPKQTTVQRWKARPRPRPQRLAETIGSCAMDEYARLLQTGGPVGNVAERVGLAVIAAINASGTHEVIDRSTVTSADTVPANPLVEQE